MSITKGRSKKKRFLGDLFQMCLPTHPRQCFCEIWENEKWNLGRKRRFSGQFGGVLRGLDLVWESATPPTHTWERFPKKSFCGSPNQSTHTTFSVKFVQVEYSWVEGIEGNVGWSWRGGGGWSRSEQRDYLHRLSSDSRCWQLNKDGEGWSYSPKQMKVIKLLRLVVASL